ncbi:MAG: PulJ/GspJ family protein, partial [Aureliella sp.]
MLEVLVATAVTLLMMISLAQVFKIIGDSMKQGRAALQLNNTLRSVSFRLRHDLNNLTIRVDPPADSSCGSGYFEYYDGAMTDFTCMLFDPNNGMDSSLSTDNIRSSRIGDMDDILMYTVRAGDAWFTGKVPQYILNQANPSGAAAQYAMVTISAQHAEVAVFARPLDLDLNGAYDDADGDDMPDGFQLYYRTLLIRPDLNMSDGALPYDATNSTSYGPQMIAGPQGSGLPTPACDMALAHQQCDLSIRRVF